MSELTPEQLRELDAEIAEKWFGHVWMWRIESDSVPRKGMFPSRAGAKKRGGSDIYPVTAENNPSQRYRDWDSEVPRFTTNPAASMMLLKKVAEFLKELSRKKGWTIGLTIEIIDDEDGDWHVAHDSQIVGVSAPTLELAIALFARKLKEKE